MYSQNARLLRQLKLFNISSIKCKTEHAWRDRPTVKMSSAVCVGIISCADFERFSIQISPVPVCTCLYVYIRNALIHNEMITVSKSIQLPPKQQFRPSNPVEFGGSRVRWVRFPCTSASFFFNELQVFPHWTFCLESLWKHPQKGQTGPVASAK
jgi:hypothetical protein